MQRSHASILATKQTEYWLIDNAWFLTTSLFSLTIIASYYPLSQPYYMSLPPLMFCPCIKVNQDLHENLRLRRCSTSCSKIKLWWWWWWYCQPFYLPLTSEGPWEGLRSRLPNITLHGPLASSAFEYCTTGNHITSGLKMYKKQQDSTQQFGDLVHTTLSIMAAPLKDFSFLSQRNDRRYVELGEPHEFCTQTFANGT